MSVFSERSSGILLHPTSLPGPHGTGDLGPAAHAFATFLAQAGQRWWQMLPVGPIGDSASPYDSPSSFAGTPLLISLSELQREGLLELADLVAPQRLAEAKQARYAAAVRFREVRLRKAFVRFRAHANLEFTRRYQVFVSNEADWLPDYALFRVLRQLHQGRAWTDFAPEYRRRDPLALERIRREHEAEIHYHQFLQFCFAEQWTRLKDHCSALGVKLLGDVPMFVAHDGADVWASPEMFQLDTQGRSTVVAGVPPDYFNPEGQRWGNPIYNWEAHRATGYEWWIRRLRATLRRFDAVRLDHFIGFHRYWAIPTHTMNAREGYFVEVPGYDFLGKVRNVLGSLPFIAEDLGIVTAEVHRLRDSFDLPGMRILQFAFAGDARDYQPHRYPENCAACTGTHDTDTVMGWLDAHARARSADERNALLAERKRALSYAGSSGNTPHLDMVRICLLSRANTAIFPLQDVLGLGNDARMNVPGTACDNWRFRFETHHTSPELGQQLLEMCRNYERIPAGLRIS